MSFLNKLKEEKGSITMTVLAAMLFMIACITIAFMSIFNSTISQNSKIRKIQKAYADSSTNENMKNQYYDLLDRINDFIDVKLYKSSNNEEYSLDEWTNDDLKLEITWNISIPNEYKYFFYNGVKTQYVNNYVIGNNCTIAVGYGSNKKVIEISKIDKTSPTYNIAIDIEYGPGENETSEVNTLIVYLGERTNILTGITSSDNESGIASDGVKCYINNTEISYTDYFEQVGRYGVTYKIRDNAGNEASVNREVLVRWPLAGKYVVARQNIVGTGLATGGQTSGLYRDTTDTGLDSSLPFSSQYYYSGANVNNYISFAGKTFRIMNIPVNNCLKIIGELSSKKVVWGSSLTTEQREKNRKIFTSELFETWQNTWWNEKKLYNSDDSQYIEFIPAQWNHIKNGTFYAGRFNSGDDTTFVALINKERTSAIDLGADSAAFQGYSAFPNVSDYIRACNSLDTIYNIQTSKNNATTFKTNSWLKSDDDQWTINSENNTTSDNDFWTLETDVVIGLVKTQNKISARTYYLSQQYRPVLYLKENTILSGTGTSSDPFTVQENWAWFDSYQQKQ